MSDYFSCLNRSMSLWAIIFSALLTGCMASSVNIIRPITQTTPITHDGVVVAKVINASGSMLPFNQLTITPKDVNKSKENKSPRLVSLNDPDGDTSLFASPIPPGEYSVDSARSFYVIGEYFYSVWASAGVELGTFSVEPGKITDLGTFIYYRKVDGDKYVDKLIRIPDSNNQKFIETYRPFLKYNSTNLLSWHDDGLNADRFSNYAALAQNPTVFTAQYLAPSGSLYMLGKLGAIIERAKSGTWSMDVLETNAKLNVITANLNNDLMVGGDQGALFYKKNGSQWKDLSLGLTSSVDAISFLPSGEVLVYGVEYGMGVVLKGNPNLPNPNWKTILSFSATRGWQDADGRTIETGLQLFKKVQTTLTLKRIKAMRLSQFQGENFVRISVQKASAKDEFNTMDSIDSLVFKLSPDLKSIQHLDAMSGDVDSILDMGVTKLGVKFAGFWSWTGKDEYFRYDETTTSWEKISTQIINCEMKGSSKCIIDGKPIVRKENFNFLSAPVFMSPLKGFAVVRKYNYQTPVTYFLKTETGGKTWEKLKVELPGKFCTDIVPEITDRILLHCSGVSGDFYESTDEGKTWDHVRQHENF